MRQNTYIQSLLLTIAFPLAAACTQKQYSVPDATVKCTEDSRAMAYSPGLMASASDGVAVVLVSANPAPPSRFDNSWTIKILDREGNALEVEELVVEPYMPEHGHGTPQPPKPEAGQNLGMFTMTGFDLWMPGIWEMKFSVKTKTATSDVVMTFCIEE